MFVDYAKHLTMDGKSVSKASCLITEPFVLSSGFDTASSSHMVEIYIQLNTKAFFMVVYLDESMEFAS